MLSEEVFYFNRQKSLTDGVILTIVSLLFQPFYLFFNEGLTGILVSLLPFHFLIRGLIYILRSFWPRSAIQLTPQGLEFETLFLFRRKLKWSDIRSIERKEVETSHSTRSSGGGLRFRLSDFEKQSIVLQTNEDKSYSISIDAIDLEGTDLEQLLRDYRRTYYFYT